MAGFRKQSRAARPVLVGTGGLPLEAFFDADAATRTAGVFFG